jgi:hypothetical protein
MIAARNRHCCVILEMNILLSTSQEIQCRTVQVLVYDFNNKGILKYFEKVILDNLVWGSWRLINREAAYEKCKLFQTRLSSIANFFSRRINQWECSIHIKLNYLVLSVTFKKMWIKIVTAIVIVGRNRETTVRPFVHNILSHHVISSSICTVCIYNVAET